MQTGQKRTIRRETKLILILQIAWVILLAFISYLLIASGINIVSVLFTFYTTSCIVLTIGIIANNQKALKMNIIPHIIMALLYFVLFIVNMIKIFPDSPGSIIVFVIQAVPFLIPSLIILFFYLFNRRLIFD
jgi:hypothetical protein